MSACKEGYGVVLCGDYNDDDDGREPHEKSHFA